MKLSVNRTDVWAATIDDHPGGLAEKLEALAAAGASLEFVLGRRMPDRPGKGVVFVTPLRGIKQMKAAKVAGFQKTEALHSIRVEGADKAGIGARMTAALAGSGISLRGISAAALGRKFVCHLALDTSNDASKAMSVLKKLA